MLKYASNCFRSLRSKCQSLRGAPVTRHLCCGSVMVSMKLSVSMNDDAVAFVAMNVEVLAYCCHELRNDAERNDLLVNGFPFGTIPDEAAVEGYDEAAMLLQFKLFGKRKDAIKRTSAGKDDGQSSLLRLNKNPLSIRRYGFACGEQSAIEVCS